MSVASGMKPSQLGGPSFRSAPARLAVSTRWRLPISCSTSSTPETFVRIYWDLDNIKPPAKLKACTNDIVRALKETVAEAASEGLGRQIAAGTVELHGHCNCHTIQQLSKELKHALLTQEGNSLSTAIPDRKEVVDQDIIASMLRFAGEHRSDACVGLISSDQGFAKALRYCRSLDCHTVVACKGRPYSGKACSMKWGRQPLQAAADAALSWDALLDAVRDGESPTAALLQEHDAEPESAAGMG
ncbi:g2472 [Coccomyxa viridis]|uniref:G2472 protein n=1 Tax=Coccomyxa viridis TaxID=1274662 RepID=A0ABP1FQP2_9CHLO